MKEQTTLSLISKAEWWIKKVEVNTVRGTFNMNLYLKYLTAKKNEYEKK